MMTDYDTSVLRRLEIVCLCLLRISNLVAPFCSPFFNSLITQFMRKMSHHLMSRLLKWTGHAFKKVKIYSNFTQSMSIHPSIHPLLLQPFPASLHVHEEPEEGVRQSTPWTGLDQSVAGVSSLYIIILGIEIDLKYDCSFMDKPSEYNFIFWSLLQHPKIPVCHFAHPKFISYGCDSASLQAAKQ